MEILSFIDFYINNFKSYKEHWNYEDGCIMKGAKDLYEATKEKKYYDFMKDYVDTRVSDNGEIKGFDYKEFNIDNVNTGKMITYLYEKTGEEKYRLALDSQYHQLENHPRTNEGNFWHKEIYPNQVWLDGLYMAMPFYASYVRLIKPELGYKDIINQFENVSKRMKDSETGLYYHGYDESKKERWSNPETGLSKHFWSRAMGWFEMALIDTIEAISQEEDTSSLKDILKETLEALMKYQDKDSKMWYQVIDRLGEEGNYLETSGTLMIAYAMMKGARLKVLDNSFQAIGAEVFEMTAKKYLDLKNNKLHGICGVAGLGNIPYRDGTYEYYISEREIVNDHKGVGALMMAYSEYCIFMAD